MPESSATPEMVFILLSAVRTAINYSYCIDTSAGGIALKKYQFDAQNLQRFYVFAEFRECGCANCSQYAYYSYEKNKYVRNAAAIDMEPQPDQQFMAEVRRAADLRFMLLKARLSVSTHFSRYYADQMTHFLPDRNAALGSLFFDNLEALNRQQQIRVLLQQIPELNGNFRRITFDWLIRSQLKIQQSQLIAHLQKSAPGGEMMDRLRQILRDVLSNVSVTTYPDLENISKTSYMYNGLLQSGDFKFACASQACFKKYCSFQYNCDRQVDFLLAFDEDYSFSYAAMENEISYTGQYNFKSPADIDIVAPLSIFSPYFHFNMIEAYSNNNLKCQPSECSGLRAFDFCFYTGDPPFPESVVSTAMEGGIFVDYFITGANLIVGGTTTALSFSCGELGCQIYRSCTPEGRIVAIIETISIEVIDDRKQCLSVKSKKCLRFVGQIQCQFQLSRKFTGDVIVVGDEPMLKQSFADTDTIELEIPRYFNNYLVVFAAPDEMGQTTLDFGEFLAVPMPELSFASHLYEPVAIKIARESKNVDLTGFSYLSDKELQDISSVVLTLFVVFSAGMFLLFITLCSWNLSRLRKGAFY